MRASETQILAKASSMLMSPLAAFPSPGNYSTSLQTPSPQPRKEFLAFCKCGCKDLLQFKDRLNCKGCGAFAIRQSGSLYIFVSLHFKFIFARDLI